MKTNKNTYELHELIKHFNYVLFSLNNVLDKELKVIEVELDIRKPVYDLVSNTLVNNTVITNRQTVEQFYQSNRIEDITNGPGPQHTAYLLSLFPNDIDMQALIWLAAATKDKSKTGELPEQWKSLRMDIAELKSQCHIKLNEHGLGYWHHGVKYTYPFNLHDNEAFGYLLAPKNIKDIVTLIALEVKLIKSNYTVTKLIPKELSV